jgi:hypothetical protein
MWLPPVAPPIQGTKTTGVLSKASHIDRTKVAPSDPDFYYDWGRTTH